MLSLTGTNAVTAVVLIIFMVGLILYYKFKKPTEEQRKEAEAFLEELKTIVLSVFAQTLENSDITALNVNDFKINIIDKVYDHMWDYTSDKIAENIANGDMSKVVRKIVDKDTVNEFVNTILNSIDAEKEIEVVYETKTNEIINEMLKNEEESNKMYELAEAAAEDEEDTEDYRSEFEIGRDNNPEQEYPDEESEYSDDDETVEVVE